MGKVEEPPIPPYPFKYGSIPIMEDYSKDLSDQYWDKWVRNPYSKEINSWISGKRLIEAAEVCGYPK